MQEEQTFSPESNSKDDETEICIEGINFAKI